MPQTMRRLAWVQIFTWLGLFCMWLYFGVAVARNIFGGTPGYAGLRAGHRLGRQLLRHVLRGLLRLLVRAAGRGRAAGPQAHPRRSACSSGAIGLLSVAFIGNKYLLLLSMVGVGIAWASILSMPYSILAGALPAGKTGIYMGIFNFFIVIPEILAALGFGTIMERLLTDESRAGAAAGRRQPARRRRHRRSLAGGGGRALHPRHRPERGTACVSTCLLRNAPRGGTKAGPAIPEEDPIR